MPQQPARYRVAHHLTVAIGTKFSLVHGEQLIHQSLVLGPMVRGKRIICRFHQLVLALKATPHISENGGYARALPAVTFAVTAAAFHQWIENPCQQETQALDIGVNLAHAGGHISWSQFGHPQNPNLVGL